MKKNSCSWVKKIARNVCKFVSWGWNLLQLYQAQRKALLVIWSWSPYIDDTDEILQVCFLGVHLPGQPSAAFSSGSRLLFPVLLKYLNINYLVILRIPATLIDEPRNISSIIYKVFFFIYETWLIWKILPVVCSMSKLIFLWLGSLV